MVCHGLSRRVSAWKYRLIFIESCPKVNDAYFAVMSHGHNLLPEKHLNSSRTMFWLTECATQNIHLNMHLLLYHRGYGHPTAQTLMRSTTKSGACCRDKSIIAASTMSTTLSSILSKTGITLTTESSSKLFNCLHVCENADHFEHTLQSCE